MGRGLRVKMTDALSGVQSLPSIDHYRIESLSSKIFSLTDLTVLALS